MFYGYYPYFRRQSSILTVKCCFLRILTLKDATYDCYACKIRIITWKSTHNNGMWRALRVLLVYVPKLDRERFSRIRPPLREKLLRDEIKKRMSISLKKSIYVKSIPLYLSIKQVNDWFFFSKQLAFWKNSTDSQRSMRSIAEQSSVEGTVFAVEIQVALLKLMSASNDKIKQVPLCLLI